MTDRNIIASGNFVIRPVSDEELKLLSPNFCGNKDLDEYFKIGIHKHQKALMIKTYKLISQEDSNLIMGLVCLRNDSLNLEYRQIDKLGDLHEDVYPAVKIERFAVNKDVQRLKLGSIFLSMLKTFFTNDNRTGCRFLTVDPFFGVIDFYEFNGFIELENSSPINKDELAPDDVGPQYIFNLLGEA